MSNKELYRARAVVAYTSGLSIILGFVLVLLNITGAVDWRGEIPGSKFHVTCTHIGIGFALVGMFLAMTVVLRQAEEENTSKRTVEYGGSNTEKPGSSIATSVQDGDMGLLGTIDRPSKTQQLMLDKLSLDIRIGNVNIRNLAKELKVIFPVDSDAIESGTIEIPDQIKKAVAEVSDRHTKPGNGYGASPHPSRIIIEERRQGRAEMRKTPE